MGKAARLKAIAKAELLKLDFGCGKNKRPGFLGIDIHPFEGIDHVVDLRGQWPWKDASVEEANASHFIEHLDAWGRVHFFNELYRVLIPGGKCAIVVPHWASNRAYGDPTHQWPPVSEMAMYYLMKGWRTVNAPHTDIAHEPRGYSCDFDAVWGYSIRGDLNVRNSDYQQYALANFKEAAQDMLCTLTKPEKPR